MFKYVLVQKDKWMKTTKKKDFTNGVSVGNLNRTEFKIFGLFFLGLVTTEIKHKKCDGLSQYQHLWQYF